MTGIKSIRFIGLRLFIFLFVFQFPISGIATAAKSTKVAEKKAGKTLLTRGSVISARAGKKFALKRRSVVYQNDEIRVGKGGRAQFRMIDKAIISLQEDSVLQIKKYQYTQGAKNNSALLELLSGGLRTITGAIGKGNKKAYELRTPLATIGIRGTDYEVEVVSNGMFVAVWDGVIHLRARARNGCNILLGRSQPFMFIFIDQLGKCHGLEKVPDVFKNGHSSNIRPPLVENEFVAGKTLPNGRVTIDPIAQLIQDGTLPPSPPTMAPPVVTPPPVTPPPVTPPPVTPPPVTPPPVTPPPVTPPPVTPPPVTPPPVTPPVTPPPVTPPPAITFNHNALAVDQSKPSTELDINASELGMQAPIFEVGLNQLENVAGGVVENFQQSVGGFAVSWGYWGEFNSSLASRNADNNTDRGLIWATYEATDPAIVRAKTGSFSRYETIVDSLISGSVGPASNLQVQMDMNFDTGDVTNGALSVNTPEETWVAVFDGKFESGDLDLQMNGASVINSDPNTPSPVRNASETSFITGDFVGSNAEAVLGSFGLSEEGNTSNHVEGVFIVK